MLTRQNRIALHMVDTMPLRSDWICQKGSLCPCGMIPCDLGLGRKPSVGRGPPLLPWWMKGALLVLFVAIVVVATARILRAAL